MLLTKVIERTNARREDYIAKKKRQEDVHQLFIDTAFKHELEFKSVFKMVRVGIYTIITIHAHNSGYDYNVAVSSLPDRETGKYTLNIGYNANSASGSKRIPFSYDNTDIQLIRICENALKVLASMCL